MVRPVSDIGAAVIGSGFIGTVHVEALRRLGVTVHGILGLVPERAAGARQRSWASPRAYASLDELLDDPRVEVVHVTSPNQLHYPQVKAILAAGRHVVCEKPLAVTSERVGRAGAAGGGQRPDHARSTTTSASTPSTSTSMARSRDGQLGDIRLVTGRYFQDWLFLDTDWNWRLDPDAGWRRCGRSGTSAPIGSTSSASSPARR